MTSAYEVAKDIFLIDTEMYSIPGFTASYVLGEKKLALIESGPATSATTVVEGMRQLGFNPKDVDYIIVTHIHLDHAGGAGTLLSDMPNAQVLVHEVGARHLIDPSRMMASVRQVQGEKGIERDGAMVPIPAEQVRAVKDGEIIELSEEQHLQIIYTPGHAKHHICILDSKNKGLFTGDITTFVPEEELILPTTPPPDFDLDMLVDTIEKLMAMDIEMLLFSHFGVTRNVERVLGGAIQKLKSWGDIVREAAEIGNLDEAAAQLRADASQVLAPMKHRKDMYDYQVVDFMPVCAAGYLNYYRKKRDNA